MKKRIVTIALVVALLATCFAGTYAYLTDKDQAVNTMTLGNVDIEQIEQERDAQGNLVTFTQNKPAYPFVGEIAWAENGVVVNGTEYKAFAMENVVDKIVTVKNTGKSDAYVRTIIALEAPDYDPNDLIGINWNATDGVLEMSEYFFVEINDVKWVCAAFTYNAALAPQEISQPSLVQVYLNKKATNEDCAKFGDTWEILALSQAVQAAGFENANAALNEAFGEVTNANLIEWFEEVIAG